MSSPQITWDDPKAAPPQIKWDDEQKPAPRDRVADSLENATISPPETGIAASIDRFKNKVRDFMGADHKPAGDVMGGMVLGPINAAHGAAISPYHPIRGTHEVISGVGQTLALPLAVANPGTMAYSAPSIIAGTGAHEGLKALGADKDWADLGGDAAGIFAGVKTLNPNAMKIPVRKIVQTGMAINEGIPGLNRLNKLAEAPGKIREIWRKPEPTAEGTASGPVESEPETTITPLRATSPKAAQTEILRKAGVASPAATIKPMTRVPNADITPRADLKFSGSHSGEEAAMNQLTENVTPDRLGINELRGIAQQRGIKVSPGDNHVALYRKIQDSLTPEEIEQFDQARIERMQPDYSLPPISRAAEQGGHAGNGVSSVEELGRPGINYVVSKSGQLTYHGKSFAPEGIPAGSTHVTALPDGTLRVNAGPKLTEAQEMTLRKAIPETEPRVPVSDADRENLLMRSIQRAKSAKAGD